MPWENAFDKTQAAQAKEQSTRIQHIAPSLVASGLMAAAKHRIKLSLPSHEHSAIDSAWRLAAMGQGPLHDVYVVAHNHVTAIVQKLDHATGDHLHQAAAWLDARSDDVMSVVHTHWNNTRPQ